MEGNKELQDQNIERGENAVPIEDSSTSTTEAIIANEATENIISESELTETTSEENSEQIETEKVADTASKEEPQSPTLDEVNTIEQQNEIILSTEDNETSGQDTEEGDDHTISEEDFIQMSREDLLQSLEDAVKKDNINTEKARISAIRLAFNHKTKEKKQEDYKVFVENGAEKESFIETSDEIEISFNQLLSVYRQKKIEYNKQQEELKIENLAKKNEILEQLRLLINSEEPLKKTYDEFRDLQDQWRNSGMVPRTDLIELWKNYHFLVDKFFDKVKINKELRDIGLKRNLQKKIELCEKTEDLFAENSITRSFKLLQKYHERWREIGPVPKENNEEIWQRFKTASERINDRRKEFYKQQDEIQEINYKEKVLLVEKLDEINKREHTSLKDWVNSTNEINDIFAQWKKIGRAPLAKNEEIWDLFKSKLDYFHSSKKIYFKDLKELYKENIDKKMEIVLRAEAIKESEEWRETKEELIQLQKQWKEIGYIPRKQSEALWKRFRAACDHFFSRRDLNFKDARENEQVNLEMKLVVLEKAKNYTLCGEKTEDLDALKQLQREWMEIGFVPIKEKNKIQSAFKEAIDALFDKLNVSAMEKRSLDFKNRIDKLKEEPNSERKIYNERNFLSNKLAQMQDDLKLLENNIGFFSDSKKSNNLKEEFQKKIERAKEEIRLLKSKIKLLANTERSQQE